MERADAEDRILISADSECAVVLADYASTILMHLPAIEHGLFAGCAATQPIGGPQQQAILHRSSSRLFYISVPGETLDKRAKPATMIGFQTDRVL